MQQNQDDFNDLIDTFENIDRITQSRPKKIFPTKEPSRQSIMDQLLKETFDLNDTKVPVLGFKNEKYEGFDEDEDVLENVIKSFDKKENFVKYNEELDPEDLMREFEANEEKEKFMKDRFDKIYSKNKAAPQNPLIILRKDKKYSSHEMVEEQLTYFQKVKTDRFYKISPLNLLRAKSNSEFDPSLVYTPEEAQTMLKFNKDSYITIMAAFTSEWLLGFLSNEGEQESNVKIFPLMMVSPMFSSLIPCKRDYEIKFWSIFGVFDKKEEKEPVAKSLVDHIFQDSSMKPKAIHQAIKDFNFTNPEMILFDNIQMLSLRKGDLIAVTKLQNMASWAEGFVINKEVLKLGIFHAGFTTLIKFKFES